LYASLDRLRKPGYLHWCNCCVCCCGSLSSRCGCSGGGECCLREAQSGPGPPPYPALMKRIHSVDRSGWADYVLRAVLRAVVSVSYSLVIVCPSVWWVLIAAYSSCDSLFERAGEEQRWCVRNWVAGSTALTEWLMWMILGPSFCHSSSCFAPALCCVLMLCCGCGCVVLFCLFSVINNTSANACSRCGSVTAAQGYDTP
jgi:hypothetical protein